MVKIEITKSGIYDQDENPIPVGTVLDVTKEPTGWVNKYRVLASSEGKTLEPATPGPTPVEDITDYGEPEQDEKPRPAKRRGRPRKESGGKDDA